MIQAKLFLFLLSFFIFSTLASSKAGSSEKNPETNVEVQEKESYFGQLIISELIQDADYVSYLNFQIYLNILNPLEFC